MVTPISAARLVLRAALEADIEAITAIVSDPRVHTRLARVAPGQTRQDTARWIAGHPEGRAADTDHVYAIEAGGVLCGMIGAHRKDGGAPFSIGYWLAPSHWGQGLATEAGHALIGWLTERGNGRALVSGYFADNPASGRVLRKLDFLPAGREPMYCAGRDRVVDHVNMARIG